MCYLTLIKVTVNVINMLLLFIRLLHERFKVKVGLTNYTWWNIFLLGLTLNFERRYLKLKAAISCGFFVLPKVNCFTSNSVNAHLKNSAQIGIDADTKSLWLRWLLPLFLNQNDTATINSKLRVLLVYLVGKDLNFVVNRLNHKVILQSPSHF